MTVVFWLKLGWVGIRMCRLGNWLLDRGIALAGYCNRKAEEALNGNKA